MEGDWRGPESAGALAELYRGHFSADYPGIPQERALGSIALLNRYGPAFVQRLMQELPLDPRHHWVLTI